MLQARRVGGKRVGAGRLPAAGAPCPRPSSPYPPSGGGAPLAPPPRAVDGAAAAWTQIVHGVQQELVMEGVLHTTLGTQITCAERFGANDLKPAPALSAAGASLALAAAAGPGADVGPPPATTDDTVVGKAACLATPVEPLDDSRSTSSARAALVRLRAPEAPAAAEPYHLRGGMPPGATGARPIPVPAESEDPFVHLELWQRRVALLECAELAAEHIRKTAPVRRRRRLALVRAVREARDGAKGLVQAVRPDGQRA